MLGRAPPVPQLAPVQTTDERTKNESNEQQINPNANTVAATEDHPNPEMELRVVEDMHGVRVDAAAGRLRVSFSAGVSLSRTPEMEASQQPQNPAARAQKPMDDRLLTWAALGLTVAIVALLVKKFLKSSGISGYVDGL